MSDPHPLGPHCPTCGAMHCDWIPERAKRRPDPMPAADVAHLSKWLRDNALLYFDFHDKSVAVSVYYDCLAEDIAAFGLNRH